mgnify:FL=1
MSEDIEKIRAEKIAALQAKMKKADEENEEITAMKQEFTWSDFGYGEPPFGFRESEEMPGAFDICQERQAVAITGDPRFAMLVTDLLNRAKKEELIINHKAGEIKDE